MVRHENETEDLLLSVTENCQTLIDRSHTKAQETLQLKFTKPKEIFSFKSSTLIEGSWMIGFTN